MREILFRAKSNYGNVGEWEYGLVAQPHVTENGIVTSYYFTKICENGWTSQRTVSANTIGQYTGLTDKNGTKIFEDDFAKNIDGLFLVCWDKEKSAFVMRFQEYPYETLYLEEMWEDSEVIGNIHDNPELLKGGAE